MHLAQQITPFTCGLACIESYATDAGQPITQSELLVRYKSPLLMTSSKVEVFGAASIQLIDHILRDLGFATAPIKDHRKDVVRNELSKCKGAIICANYMLSGWHCWRFEKVIDNDTISAMNPGFFHPAAIIESLAFDDLIKWDFSFVLIS